MFDFGTFLTTFTICIAGVGLVGLLAWGVVKLIEDGDTRVLLFFAFMFIMTMSILAGFGAFNEG